MACPAWGPRLQLSNSGSGYERPTGTGVKRPDLACFLIAGTRRPISPQIAIDMQRFLIGLGLVVLLAGLAWPWLGRIGLGRLPGDILFQRGNTTFYFPLGTCLLISIVLSGLFWLFNR